MRTKRILQAAKHAYVAVGLTALLVSGDAMAQTGWTPVEGQSRAVLPAPADGEVISSAEMSCGAQLWTLSLVPANEVEAASLTGRATLSVGTRSFAVDAAMASGSISIEISAPALEAISSGNRLVINLPGDRMVAFALGGSRRAIAAADALCSPRVMPTKDSVALSPYSSYLTLAGRLRKDDVDDFVASTSSQPRMRAGMVELDGDRRLLFAELCGSSWYYGVSGCSLAGFAPRPGGNPDDTDGWKRVYETEGAFLYTDPDHDVDGWPDLRAIPLKDGDERRWRWTGDAYAPVATLLEAQGGGEAVDGLRR